MKKFIFLSIFFMCNSIFALQNSTIDEHLKTFLKPVCLNEDSLMHFYKCYNSSLYTKRFLPSCFLHLSDFLACAKGMEESECFVYSVLSLFYEKTKACRYINPFAFDEQLIKPLPMLLDPVLLKENLSTEQVILEAIDTYQDIYFDNPSLFARELAAVLGDREQIMHSRSEIRDLTVRLLDTAIDRIVWSPHDALDAWGSYKSIGDGLEKLFDSTIIKNIDTLRHLIVSLNERFKYFVDLHGASLPLDWYDKVKQDIPTISFLHGQEQEKFVKPMAQSFLHSVLLGETKARAYQQGIVGELN